MAEKVVILDHPKIQQKINRIAFEIYENNVDEQLIILAGLDNRGFELASRLKAILDKISTLKVELIKVNLDRGNLLADVSLNTTIDLKDKAVVIVDDVLDTGRTLIYAVKKFLEHPVKKINTAVLVDRSHHKFPVNADFVGLSLATTLQEHIHVEFSNNNDVAYLS